MCRERVMSVARSDVGWFVYAGVLRRPSVRRWSTEAALCTALDGRSVDVAGRGQLCDTVS